MHQRKLALLAVSASMFATAAIGVTASPAYANTACMAGHNAGYSNGGSGDWYWGWCHPGGGYVNYRIHLTCQYNGDTFISDWSSGSGNGTVYTNAFYCPNGIDSNYGPGWLIENG